MISVSRRSFCFLLPTSSSIQTTSEPLVVAVSSTSSEAGGRFGRGVRKWKKNVSALCSSGLGYEPAGQIVMIRHSRRKYPDICVYSFGRGSKKNWRERQFRNLHNPVSFPRPFPFLQLAKLQICLWIGIFSFWNSNALTMSSSSSASRPVETSLQVWKERLLTTEDPMHVHKVLGLLCLTSFIWRLSQAYSDSDMGFQTYPQWTIPTILLHWSLTLSSFVFAIPAKRIKSGDRIWPEVWRAFRSSGWSMPSFFSLPRFWHNFCLIIWSSYLSHTVSVARIGILVSLLGVHDVVLLRTSESDRNTVVWYQFSHCHGHLICGRCLIVERRYQSQW